MCEVLAACRLIVVNISYSSLLNSMPAAQFYYFNSLVCFLGMVHDGNGSDYCCHFNAFLTVFRSLESLLVGLLKLTPTKY